MSEIIENMPPVDKTPLMNTGSFELINCLYTSNNVPVCEYKSKKTGLSVFVAEVAGPIINGYFCLATEAFDDDGLPHILEHLIFLGSEKYPYKGVLDLLANRCLASGTNAWTQTDHTCYTMETAGSDGFLSLMPIYLDHILYPTLTDEGYITEVHHVTSDGNDAGVVYCEMQGRESLAESKLYLTMARALYPGHCGYSSETGGVLKNFRESTTNEKVRNYHKKFYRPENFKLIITGQVKHDDLFKSLEAFEEKIISKGDRGNFERPWQSVVEPLKESKDLSMEYPADEETNGLFTIGWRGPSSVNEQYELVAITILLKYLTECSNYVLSKIFVEIDGPYASKVSYIIIENSESCFLLLFEDVPLKQIVEIKSKLMAVFYKILQDENILMKRMQDIIHRVKLQHLSCMENTPQETVAFMIIGYVLYGNTKEDLQQRIDPLNDFNKLLLEPKSFWLGLLKKYFIDNHYVSLLCIPSVKEYENMTKEEENRVKNQIEQLGENGLEKKGKILLNAIETNKRKPPIEMLTSVPVPSLKSVNFHEIIRYSWDNCDKLDLKKSPVYIYFSHVKTEFIYMYALMDSSELNDELRIYLPLMMECLFDSSIQKNGKIIPYEEVVDQLNQDTVFYNSGFGLNIKSHLFENGPFAQTLSIMVQVEVSKLNKGIEWLRDTLYNTIFTKDRVKIIATRMLNTIAQKKRCGQDIIVNATIELRYKKNANARINSPMIQQKFLAKILDNYPVESEKLLSICDQILKTLTQSNNIVLFVSANKDKVPNIGESLENFLPDNIKSIPTKLKITPDNLLLKTPESEIEGCVLGMGSIESSFFCQSVECIKDSADPDLPTLLLYLEYLIQAEGPMWQHIRGKGYSYNYRLSVKPNEGLMYMTFSKATNLIEAYNETKQIILHQLKVQEWDENLLQSARSSLIFKLIERENTIVNVMFLSLMSYFQMVDFNNNRKCMALINEVTIEDLNRVGDKYLNTFFNPKKTKTAVVTTPTKVQEIANALKEFGMNLNIYTNLEESFLNEIN